MKARIANKVFPKAGLTNFYDNIVLNRTLVFQINSFAKTPAFGNSQTIKTKLRFPKLINYNFYM